MVRLSVELAWSLTWCRPRLYVLKSRQCLGEYPTQRKGLLSRKSTRYSYTERVCLALGRRLFHAIAIQYQMQIYRKLSGTPNNLPKTMSLNYSISKHGNGIQHLDCGQYGD